MLAQYVAVAYCPRDRILLFDGIVSRLTEAQLEDDLIHHRIDEPLVAERAAEGLRSLVTQ